MMDPTDEALITKLKAGEVRSLGILYERYKSLLYNYFVRTTQDEDASNDLIMEVFERVYRYSGSFKLGQKFRPWIYQIANNLIKDHFKKIGRSVSLDSSKTEMQTNEMVVPGEALEQQKLLMTAMARLNPSERNIINMYYLLEMGYEEIAAVENMTVNTARIHVCRGLKKLHTILKDSGI